MKSLAWMAMLGLGLTLGAGCDSNPTPHPEGDATTRVDTMQPVGEGPDDDGDGVPDCAETGGYWTGESCRNDLGTPDASSDTIAPTADAGDAVDGDVGDVSDGDEGDLGDAVDGSESDSGPDAAD